MKRPIITAKRMLLLILVIAVGLSQFPADWAASFSRKPRDLVSLAMVPFSPIRRLCDNLWGAKPGDVGDLTVSEELQDQNYVELLALNRQLQERLAAANKTIQQLTQLRRLPLHRYELIPAEVTTTVRSPVMQSLDINRGSHHDIAEGLVVADGAHLVGRISRAGLRTATVRLITTPGTSLIVRVISPDVLNESRQHLLKVELDPETGCFVARGDKGDPVKVGDLAHLSDDSWPIEARGLVAGKVIEVGEDEKTPQLRTHIVIQPMHDLPRLSRVAVIHPMQPVVE